MEAVGCVKHTEGFFEGRGSIRLYKQSWIPDAIPRACVAVVHGVGSHSGGLMNLIAPLVSAGFAVHAYDLRGHGRSEGQRAFINSFDDYRLDTDSFMNFVREDMQRCPLFLLGHSLGGIVALDYVLRFQPSLHGLILVCPAIMPARLKQFNASISLSDPNETAYGEEPDYEKLTRDIQVIESFAKDPLRHHWKTAGLHRGALEAVSYIFQHPNRMNVPLLMQQGEDDEIVPPEDPKAFFDAVPNTCDKRYIGYPGMLHNPHDDSDREVMLEELIQWVKEKSKPM